MVPAPQDVRPALCACANTKRGSLSSQAVGLRVHTLPVPWAPRGEVGHWSPCPRKEGQVPPTSPAPSRPPPRHNHARTFGAAFLGNGRLTDSVFSMCLLPQDLGLLPAPARPGAQSSAAWSRLPGVGSRAPGPFLLGFQCLADPSVGTSAVSLRTASSSCRGQSGRAGPPGARGGLRRAEGQVGLAGTWGVHRTHFPHLWPQPPSL